MGDICAHLPDGKIRSEAAVASINWKLTAAATQPSSEKKQSQNEFSTNNRWVLFKQLHFGEVPSVSSDWVSVDCVLSD